MNDAKNLAKTATTIASYSLAIQKALEANGYDAEDIFEAAGIGRVPGPDPMDRLTTAELAAVYRESVKRSGNPAFGLTVARFMHPGAVHALGYALLASSSLRDACERLVYYFRLASEQGIYRIEEEGDRFCLILDVTTEGVAYETIDAWNAFVIRIFRMIYRPDFTPLSIETLRESAENPGFSARVAFFAQDCIFSPKIGHFAWLASSFSRRSTIDRSCIASRLDVRLANGRRRMPSLVVGGGVRARKPPSAPSRAR